jgi:uncharacterized protein YjbJ (UPF0337 family)
MDFDHCRHGSGGPSGTSRAFHLQDGSSVVQEREGFMKGVKQQVKGVGQELKGTVKGAVGTIAGNRRMEAEGDLERNVGRARQSVGRGMEQAAGAAHEARGALKRETGRALGNPRLADEGEDERMAGSARRRLNTKTEE